MITTDLNTILSPADFLKEISQEKGLLSKLPATFQKQGHLPCFGISAKMFADRLFTVEVVEPQMLEFDANNNCTKMSIKFRIKCILDKNTQTVIPQNTGSKGMGLPETQMWSTGLVSNTMIITPSTFEGGWELLCGKAKQIEDRGGVQAIYNPNQEVPVRNLAIDPLDGAKVMFNLQTRVNPRTNEYSLGLTKVRFNGRFQILGSSVQEIESSDLDVDFDTEVLVPVAQTKAGGFVKR